MALKPLPFEHHDLGGADVMIGKLDQVFQWARSNSLWPLSFGTSCCAIEMFMATASPTQDLARFGLEVARASPRQADLLVIAGTIVKRMGPRLKMLYEQMAEPRYVISTGSCAISGGPFMYGSYTTVRGADEIIPVDVYVPGCPPRPEGFFYGILTLQNLIKKGERFSEPGVRRRPVLAALPEGITVDDIRAELAAQLKKDGEVDVNAFDSGAWATREHR
jgi:NADH-quinone oxidoreductase subunit B